MPARRERTGARLPSATPLAAAIGALLAAVWALDPPATADLAAQAYRAQLFAAHGFLLWDNAWYGGHYLPGYSLLFPPLAAALGLRWTGVVLVPLGSLLFAEILRLTGARARSVAAAWFTLGLATELVIGRLTFLLGIVVALAAVLALVRGHRWLLGALGAGASIASPVAGIFLLIVGAALVLHGRRRDGAVLLAGASVPLAVSAVVASESGVQPYGPLAFATAVAMTSLFGWTVRREPGHVRSGAALYLAAIVLCFALSTPVGSNVSRFGALFGGPVLLATRRGPLAPTSVAVLGALLGWQLFGPVAEAEKTRGADTRVAAYAPLLAQLRARGAAAGRVEIVPTATRWEVVRTADDITLARGWETQLDRARNPIFFADATLTPASYRDWLRRNAVRFVVLPAMPVQRWAHREARLVRGGLTYLRRVWGDGSWNLYAVDHPVALTSGETAGAHLTHDTLSFTAGRAGTVLARVRYTPHWAVVRGDACAAPAPDGDTLVTVWRPGQVVLAARWHRGTRCPG